MFVRYAYPPNALGYCGPDDFAAFREYAVAGVADQGLVQLAQAFSGAWPYLELISAGCGIGDPLDHRVVEPVFEVPAVAGRAERAAPVRAGRPVPPLPPIAQIHRTAGRPEHQRTWHQILRRRSRIQRRVRRLLGDGTTFGCGRLGGGHWLTNPGPAPVGGGGQ